MTNLKSALFLTLLIAFCFLFSTALLYADMYSWTDENGVKHFSNAPPPQNQEIQNFDTVEEIETEYAPPTDTTKVGRPSENDKTDESDEGSIFKKKSLKNQKVVMFTTPSCGWCKRAKAFFQKHSVQYIAYDIKKSKKAYLKFKKLKGRGVPLILIGDKRISGFNKKAISDALGLK
ncbi:glutaredoxin domain-containing protein [Desulfococcaceae bacterium HSG7]|nr:glutaredoxin domain-containing protein [Desulfococcaceae bacterium HSG7]